MCRKSVIEFLTVAEKNESLRQELKNMISVSNCADIASRLGYIFTTEELQDELRRSA